MTPDAVKLPTCPFCGAELTWEQWGDNLVTTGWSLGCSADGCVGWEAGPFTDKAKCIEQASRRTPSTAASTEGEAIEWAMQCATWYCKGPYGPSPDPVAYSKHMKVLSALATPTPSASTEGAE